MNVASDRSGARGVEGAVAIGPLALVGKFGGRFAKGPTFNACGTFVDRGAAGAGRLNRLNEAARKTKFAGVPGFERDLRGVEGEQFAFELVVVGQANDASVGGVGVRARFSFDLEFGDGRDFELNRRGGVGMFPSDDVGLDVLQRARENVAVAEEDGFLRAPNSRRGNNVRRWRPIFVAALASDENVLKLRLGRTERGSEAEEQKNFARAIHRVRESSVCRWDRRQFVRCDSDL